MNYSFKIKYTIMKTITLMLFIVLAFASVASAQGKYGLGIIVGEPTGISAKMKIDETNSFDAAVGWSFNKYGAVHLHGDYLHNIIKVGPNFPIYVGIGGRIKMSSGSEEDSKLGIRFPIGIVYQLPNKPFDMFFESVPILNIIPKSEFDWNAAAGARYYFNQ